MNSLYFKDLAERVFWTAAEAALAVGAVEIANPDVVDPKAWWAVPIAAVLASLKGAVAKKIGRPESASTARSV